MAIAVVMDGVAMAESYAEVGFSFTVKMEMN